MSGVNWRLGELLHVKEEAAWVPFRIAEIVDSGLNLVEPDTGRACWKAAEELRRLWGQRMLRRERPARSGMSDAAKQLLGADLGSRPEAERAHVRWLAPYIMEFGRSGLTRHASRKALEPLILRVAAEHKHDKAPNWRTLSNHLKTWKHGLSDGRALALNIGARGNRSVRFKKFEPVMAALLDKMVFVRPRQSAKEVRSAIQAALDAYNITAAPGDRVQFKLSERTVERRIAARSEEQKVLARGGKEAVRRTCRVVGVAPEPTRPLEVVQIDHTVLDVLVVHPKTRKPLGRPVITVAIDLFTRMVVGLHVGFEEPSYRTVMLCLRSAMLSKDAILARYGLQPGSWPCEGGIKTLVMDNGPDFHGADLDDALAQLFIDRQWCRAGTPWEKGTIERWFRRLNDELVHTLPGTTFSNPKQRAGYDAEGQACLTVAEVRRLVTKWVVTDYSVDIHEGVGEAPIVRWREGVLRNPVDLPCEAGDMDILLQSSAPVALRRTGVRLHGMQYGGRQRHGRIQELLNDPAKPDVCVGKYDPDDLGWMHLLDWQTGRYLPLQCNDFDYADGLTQREHGAAAERLRREASDYRALTVPQLQKARERNRREVDELARNGKARGRKTARLADADEDTPRRAIAPASATAREAPRPKQDAPATRPVPHAPPDAGVDLGISLDSIG